MSRNLPSALCLVVLLAGRAPADEPHTFKQAAGPAGPTTSQSQSRTGSIANILRASLSPAAAQDAASQEKELIPAPSKTEAPQISEAYAAPAADDCRRGHVYADYLLWWVRRGPNPILLTTTPETSGGNARLGEPSTRVLFDEDNIDYGTFSGLRFGAGWNFGAEQFWGFEVSAFVLQTNESQFLAGPSATDIIVRPYLSALDTEEAGVEVNLPGELAGAFAVQSRIELWGADANLVAHSIRELDRRFDLLVGFRTVRLEEDLVMQERLILQTAGASIFQRDPVGKQSSIINDLPAGSTIGVIDEFHTRNRFYGGQLGGRFEWNLARLNLELLGKIALGCTRQETSIVGLSVLDSPREGHLETPGGLLAVGDARQGIIGNIGQRSRDQFSVVPELGLNASFDVTARLRARVGYSGLYWSGVVRPGDLIDRTVNPKLSPTDQDFTRQGDARDDFNPAREQTRPRFQNRDNGFWAHGVNFGIEFRY